MRVAIAVAIATLTLGLVSRPMHGQMRADDPPVPYELHMIDGQTGWAVFINTRSGEIPLLRTTDGGTHWRDVTPLSTTGGKIRVNKISVLSSLAAWVVSANTGGISTGEIFGTIDGGRTWRRAVVPARGVGLISFINPKEGWLLAVPSAWAGKAEVEIYRSTDGGATWIKLSSTTIADDSSGLPIGGSKNSITFLNPTTGWIGGIFLPGGLFLYVTHDGGRTWRQQGLPPPRELTPRWRGFPEPPKFFTARDGILPAFYDLLSDSGRVTGRLAVFYATHDGGNTWTHTAPLRVNITDPAYQAAVDMNHAWVTNGGSLHTTSDGGRRWTILPPNPLFADVTQLDFISPQVGWAVRSRFLYAGKPTFPFLLRTLDGGRTWSLVSYAVLRE